MEARLQSSVNKEIFFQTIINSIVEDINYHNKKSITAESLVKGFTFTKNLLSNNKANCKILELKKDSIIQLQYKSEKTSSIITYEFFPTEKGCDVKFSSKNYKPTGKEIPIAIGLKFITKRNMLKRLKTVERYIKNQAENHSNNL